MKKMNMRFGMGCLATVAVAAMSVSCLKDEIVSIAPSYQDGNKICFGVNAVWEEDQIDTRSGSDFGSRQGSMMLRSADSSDSLAVGVYVKEGIASPSSPATKGTPVTTANLTDFGVWCTLANNEVGTQPYFSNLQVTSNTATSYYWPGSDFTTLSFLAVAPYNPTGLTANDNTMPASFTYTVPDAPANQQDVMVAKPTYTDNTANFPGNYNKAVSLDFQHILTQVQFACTSQPEDGTIQSVSLSGNMVTSGTYTVASGEWASTTSKNIIYTSAIGESLFLVPQTIIADQVTLTVSFLDNGATTARELSATIPAATWAKSSTTTYSFAISEAYTLEFLTTNTTVLDAHYIISTLQFKTDVDWTLSVPEDAASWAYLSKEKSQSSNEEGQKEGEISSGQLAGKWSYVEKYNKQSISGTVANEGTEETVTVYLLMRENPSVNERALNLQLSKTGENTKGVYQRYTQLGYYIISDNTGNLFAMERIEDAQSPFGFSSNLGTVTYKYTGPSFRDDFITWAIASYLSGGFWLIIPTGPKNIDVNLSTNVSTISDPDSGLDNTNNAASLTATADENWLISQGWYTADTDVEISADATKSVVQYCLNKNTYGDFNGDQDDSSASQFKEVVWYVPAVNEMLKITTQESDSRATKYSTTNPSYWTSTAINDENIQAYSWYFGATAGQSTTRTQELKVRCARVLN